MTFAETNHNKGELKIEVLSKILHGCHATYTRGNALSKLCRQILLITSTKKSWKLLITSLKQLIIFFYLVILNKLT